MPLATQAVVALSANLTSCVIQAETARKLPNIAKVPILINTGEASYHATYDYCSILFLNQAGVKAKHLELGKGPHTWKRPFTNSWRGTAMILRPS